MPNGFPPSAGQQAAQPIQYGTTNLALVAGSQPANITQAAPTGPGIAITSQRLSITLVPTGTLDAGASVEVQAQINGSAFVPVWRNGSKLAYTGAQINQAGGGGGTGLYDFVDIKANQIRFVLVGQTTVGGGVITRVMD